MSIDAIVSNDTFPLSPPESYSSLSPTLSPKLTSMVPPLHEHSHTVQNKQKESHHMSIEERRHRNKLASAKYRAKKVNILVTSFFLKKKT
jgi:hypothetical protein